MGGYEQVYGLTGRAFEPAPDPRFHFPALAQRRALSALSGAINRGVGVMAVTGAQGLGKSTLVAHLVEQLAAQPATLAVMRGGDDERLGSAAAEAFGLEPSPDESHARDVLEAFLIEEMRRGRRALVMIDDGEGVTDAAAARLAALGGAHTGERCLLQIVVLREDDPGARAGEARREEGGGPGASAAMHALEPLLADEVEPYLRHRLLCAGWQGEPALDPALALLLFDATGGNPGAINRAMSTLLDQAAASGAAVVEGGGLEAWRDADRPAAMDYEIVARPAPAASEPGLAEAQIQAIEGAFAEHDRMLVHLRRELAELRDRPAAAAVAGEVEERLGGIEARLDQHEQVLRHMLERLIAYFERSGPGG